jgi:hypothetical protein
VARFVLIKSIARFTQDLSLSRAVFSGYCLPLAGLLLSPDRKLLETTKTVILNCTADRIRAVGSVGNSKRLAMKSHRT